MNDRLPRIIAVDFDGTLCENEWPRIGAPNREVIDYLIAQRRKRAKVILWTCRAGARLSDALDWCAGHDLHFDAVNENAREAVDLFGRDTRKVFAHEYIDDRNCTKFTLPFHTKNEEAIDK
jgi:hydroxymethylpyrimidine pyrophosphatase-like HAD family hydrolase